MKLKDTFMHRRDVWIFYRKFSKLSKFSLGGQRHREMVEAKMHVPRQCEVDKDCPFNEICQLGKYPWKGANANSTCECDTWFGKPFMLLMLGLLFLRSEVGWLRFLDTSGGRFALSLVASFVNF